MSCVILDPGNQLQQIAVFLADRQRMICEFDTPLLIVADSYSIERRRRRDLEVSVTPAMPSVASTAVSCSELDFRLARDVLMPASTNVSVYVPGGSASRRYSPLHRCTVTRGTGRTSARASTVTPGSTPPPVSTTFPRMTPVCCA